MHRAKHDLWILLSAVGCQSPSADLRLSHRYRLLSTIVVVVAAVAIAVTQFDCATE